MTRNVAVWAVIACFVILSKLLGAAGDRPRGKSLFERRCAGCHSLDGDKEGPRLRGVYGRRSGSVPSFKYSDALKRADITWDAVALEKWLTDPEKLVPDNDMGFLLENPDERKEIINYLQQLSGK
jgi:cytochrome c